MGALLQVPQHTANALSHSGGTSITVLHPRTMMYSFIWKMRGYWTQKWISLCLFFTVHRSLEQHPLQNEHMCSPGMNGVLRSAGEGHQMLIQPLKTSTPL